MQSYLFPFLWILENFQPHHSICSFPLHCSRPRWLAIVYSPTNCKQDEDDVTTICRFLMIMLINFPLTRLNSLSLSAYGNLLISCFPQCFLLMPCFALLGWQTTASRCYRVAKAETNGNHFCKFLYHLKTFWNYWFAWQYNVANHDPTRCTDMEWLRIWLLYLFLNLFIMSLSKIVERSNDFVMWALVLSSSKRLCLFTQTIVTS